MIRTAFLAATLLTAATLPAQGASAAVNINGRVSQVINALHSNSQFDPSSFTFSIGSGASQQTLFSGIAGVRAFNNAAALNNWVDTTAASSSVFNGGSYSFTHSVLGSFFGNSPAQAVSTPSVFDGGSYVFTHTVLNSFFDQAPTSTVAGSYSMIGAPPLNALAPVPEPASWAMMIGGFALAGAALRSRRMALRAA